MVNIQVDILEHEEPEASDYFELLKPKVMRLVVFTAAIGLLAAPNSIHPVIAIASLLCVAIGAGAAGALNMWWDADIDLIMKRTSTRPIPSGRISSDQALALGIILSILSVMMLGLFANIFAAGLLAFTIFFYVVIYSMWLKRATPQNIVIGGAAGAFPPMIGWSIASGGVGLESILMFLLIFVWTPPHFWALAINRREDYARAAIPMLPVTHGVEYTSLHIVLYTFILIAASLLPFATGMSGLLYLVGAVVLGSIHLYWSVQIMRGNPTAPMATFKFSIIYLMAIYMIMLIDHYVSPALFANG